MGSSIGFRTRAVQAGEAVELHEGPQPQQQQIDPAVRSRMAAAILHGEGMARAAEVLQQYFNSAYKPLLAGQAREEHFFEKLRKIRERYFEQI